MSSLAILKPIGEADFDPDEYSILPFISTDEVQTVTISAIAGTWTYTYAGQTTSAMAFDVSAEDFQTALIALSNIAPGDVVVTGDPGSYTLTWGGTKAATNVALGTANTVDLIGSDATGEVQTLTITADSGTYDFANDTGVAWDADASTLQGALDTAYGSGNTTITGSNPFTITFIGSLVGTNQGLVSVDGSNLLDGVDPGEADIETTTAHSVGNPTTDVQTTTQGGTDGVEERLEVGYRTFTVDVEPSADTDLARGTALIAAFNKLISGSVLTIPPGTYQVATSLATAPLNLANLTGVTIRGQGATVKTVTGGDHLRINGCTDIKISGVTFLSNSPTWSGFGGLFCAINLSSSLGNSRITIENCAFMNLGDQGIAHITGSALHDNVTVNHCYFENIGTKVSDTVDGSAFAGVGDNTVFTNNIVVNCWRGVEIYNGSNGGTTLNIVIANNLFLDSKDYAIALAVGAGTEANLWRIVVANNVIDTVTDYAIAGPAVAGGVGISLTGGENYTVTGNIITNCERYGIIVSPSGTADCRRILLSNNNLNTCGQIYHGALIVSGPGGGLVVEDIEILANIISDSPEAGIHIAGTTARIRISGNSLRNNDTLNNNQYGIYFAAGTHTASEVSRNTVSSASKRGLVVETNGTSGLIVMHNIFPVHANTIADAGVGTVYVGNIDAAGATKP